MDFHAHTKSNPDGSLAPDSEWEPLFTPFGTADPGDPRKACSGRDGADCPHCRELEPYHGHLNKVAWWTATFAADMFPPGPDREAARQWGYLAGLWHDLGKFSEAFQSYLQGKGPSPDHSTAGAQLASNAIPQLGHFIAYGIAGHHSGLLDATSNHVCQASRLKKADLPDTSDASTQVSDQDKPVLPVIILSSLRSSEHSAFSASLFTRLLYSCLIDADFLATEAFMNPRQAGDRNRSPIDSLRSIDELLTRKLESFGTPNPDDLVNRQRASVLADCTSSASKPPGLFTLTVPTGGGKTLSSLRFAVRHALAHGQRRIIYVVPFTSIIEQNAEVLRDIVQPLIDQSFTPLVEHHSNLDPDNDTPQSRLATENWDAPVIITTAVQFYESLFAAKTSRSRKVHRIANAVVILDEAQTLPVSYLHPCLRVLQELADTYHATSVLCTATQPAIGRSDDFPIGLREPTEIIRGPAALFAALDRVRIEIRGHLSDHQLAEEIASRPQALCVVNRIPHARAIFESLGVSDEHFHLSARMCPQHRSEVMASIRQRLEDGLPTRIVSTHLIEAGVDIDLPVVFRSLAGLDSIAQAAGRCNRHGKLPGKGEVHVFEAEDQNAEAYFRATAQVARQVIALHDDLLGESAIHRYFDLYYYQQKSKWDEHGILDCFELRGGSKTLPFHFQFRTAAENFRLINDDQVQVIIPYDEPAKKLIADLRNEAIPLHRNFLRRLQRYTVSIRSRLFETNRRSFEPLRDDQFHVLISPDLNYSPHFGLVLDDDHATSRFLNV